MHVWYRWTEESRQTEIDARERNHNSRGELRRATELASSPRRRRGYSRRFHESSRSSRRRPPLLRSAPFGSISVPRGRNTAGSCVLSRGSRPCGQVRPIFWGGGVILLPLRASLETPPEQIIHRWLVCTSLSRSSIADIARCGSADRRRLLRLRS